MKKELRVECLSILLALKNALKKQDNKTANDIEALQLINEVIEVISNEKKKVWLLILHSVDFMVALVVLLAYKVWC